MGTQGVRATCSRQSSRQSSRRQSAPSSFWHSHACQKDSMSKVIPLQPPSARWGRPFTPYCSSPCSWPHSHCLPGSPRASRVSTPHRGPLPAPQQQMEKAGHLSQWHPHQRPCSCHPPSPSLKHWVGTSTATAPGRNTPHHSFNGFPSSVRVLVHFPKAPPLHYFY